MATPTFQYNIAQLLKDAFGVVGFRSPSDIPRNTPFYVTGYNEIPPIEITETTAKSYLGTPIIMPVSFDAVTWTQIINGEKKERSLPQITLPPATLIDFTQPVIIEKTRIAGRNGSVKEYINLDDWSIRIRGIIVNGDSDELPEAEIKQIRDLKNCPVGIPILNRMAELLDIKNVMVEEVDFPALEGYPGAQPFTLNLVSDEPFELKYKNGL